MKTTLLRLLLLVLLCAFAAQAQTTSISGTITDANSQAYANGTYTFTLTGPQGPYYLGGVLMTPAQTTITGALDGTGSFSSVAVGKTASISPAQTTWLFTACPLASSPCYSQNIGIVSGTTMNITSTITPPAIKVLPTPNVLPLAYQDAEIQGPVVGTNYYNLTLATSRVCTAISGGVCTWATAGGSVTSVFSRTGAVTAQSGDYTCAQVTSCGAAGFPAAANFVASTGSCGGASNCLQLTADDSTNNCGTALTTWITAINAYSGSGTVYVSIYGGAKPYLFSTCNLAFNLSNPVYIWTNAGFDAGSNTSNNLIQFAAGMTETWNGGTFNGGASLVNAGIEVLSGTGAGIANIYNTTWGNFGAGNATLGLCTNWAIKIDSYIAEGNVDFNQYFVSDSTTGRCAFTNGGGTSIPAGNSTVYFMGNTVAGKSGSSCAGIGIQDGGSYGAVNFNNIGNMAAPVQLQGNGHRVDGNQLDTEGCTPASGVPSLANNATIQYAGNPIPSVVITNNQAQFGSGHATNLIAPFSTGSTIQNWTITNNQQAVTTANTAVLVPANTPCGAGAVIGYISCYVAGNQAIGLPLVCGATGTGWQIGTNLADCTSTTAGANVGSTLAYTQTNSSGSPRVRVNCQVMLTTAATTSSTLPQCEVTYTENQNSVAETVIVTPVWAANTAGCSGSTTNTQGNSCSATIYINPKLNTGISYQTINYASVGGTAMVAKVFVDVENASAQ